MREPRRGVAEAGLELWPDGADVDELLGLVELAYVDEARARTCGIMHWWARTRGESTYECIGGCGSVQVHTRRTNAYKSHDSLQVQQGRVQMQREPQEVQNDIASANSHS